MASGFWNGESQVVRFHRPLEMNHMNMEQNIYVWMDLRSSDNRGGKSSRIVFIGKENECIEFVRCAKWSTLKREFGKAYNAFWTMMKPEQMICTVSAGRKGINRIEKSYTVNIK